MWLWECTCTQINKYVCIYTCKYQQAQAHGKYAHIHICMQNAFINIALIIDNDDY